MSQLRNRLHTSLIVGLALAALAVSLNLGCSGDSATIGLVQPASSAVPTAADIESEIVKPSPTATRPPTPSIDEVGGDGVGIVGHQVHGLMYPDPLADLPSNHFPFGEVFSGLVRIADGLDGTIEPDLATSWTIGDDGMRYTFTLRDGLRFSDGSNLTAADVKWSWERALSPGYATERSREVFGAVVGSDEMLAGAAQQLAGVEVIDDATLNVRLTRPQSHFVALLADPTASVLSRENVSRWGTVNWVQRALSLVFQEQGGDDFRELPVGTGPFRIAYFDLSRNIAGLEPNPHSWRRPPNVEAVWVGVLLPASAQVSNRREFEAADADVMAWGTDQAGVHEVVLDFGAGEADEYLVHPGSLSPRTSFVALNSAVGPYNDLEFRRALLRAASRDWDSGDTLVEVPAEPASGLLPPGFAGYGGRNSEFDRDEAIARRHFGNTPYATGEPLPELEFVDDGSAPYEEDGGFFQSFSRHWTDWLGIPVHYTSDIDLSDGEFLRRKQTGTLQMRYVHVQPRYPDPCAILCRIPDLFGPNARSDETRELRDLLDDAAATADRAARIAKYQAIEDHILDRALVIPVFWDDGTVYRLVKPYISGYKVPAYGGSMYEDVVVDTTHPDYPPERLAEGGVR